MGAPPNAHGVLPRSSVSIVGAPSNSYGSYYGANGGAPSTHAGAPQPAYAANPYGANGGAPPTYAGAPQPSYAAHPSAYGAYGGAPPTYAGAPQPAYAANPPAYAPAYAPVAPSSYAPRLPPASSSGGVPNIVTDREHWFLYWDKDGSGQLDVSELVNALIVTFELRDPARVAGMRGILESTMVAFDMDCNGAITMQEFVRRDGLGDAIVASLSFRSRSM